MPSHRAAEGVLILRVNLDGNTIKPPGNPTQRWTKEYLVNHVILYTSDALQMDHWDKFEIPLPSVMPGEMPVLLCLFYSFMTNPQAWQ